MRKVFKFLIVLFGVLVSIVTIFLIVCNQIVVNNAEGKVFNDLDSIKHNKVGLLLGTTPQTRIGGCENYFFKYRIDAAEALYKSGKINTLLISGDENSLDGVNEVASMRDSLMARGVPECDIMLDGKGFRTLDSVVRAVKVYGIHSFVVISQKFHNERAIYLAEHLNLDVDDITGYNAEDPNSKMALMTYMREYLARVKVFLDILMNKKPLTYERSDV
ncbi:MAG: YdcF family protein [Bacteroidaceae bacterium]|nr:YdcF family protein [Bacteroidaceae bacterium]